MSSLSFRSSRPDRWLQPKPYSDTSLRYRMHGRIQPMEEPGFFARLFGIAEAIDAGIRRGRRSQRPPAPFTS